MTHKFLLVCVLFFLSLQPAVAQKKLYKWVDDKGVTHYGDSVPAEYSGKVSKKGGQPEKEKVTISPEEIERKKEEEKQRAEIRKKDQILLDSYSSASEVDLARDRTLQKLNRDIQNAKARIADVKKQLLSFQRQAEGFTKRQQAVPPDISQAIAVKEQEIQDQEKYIGNRETDIVNANKKYDNDKQRYIELTKKTP